MDGLSFSDRRTPDTARWGVWLDIFFGSPELINVGLGKDILASGPKLWFAQWSEAKDFGLRSAVSSFYKAFGVAFSVSSFILGMGMVDIALQCQE